MDVKKKRKKSHHYSPFKVVIHERLRLYLTNVFFFIALLFFFMHRMYLHQGITHESRDVLFPLLAPTLSKNKTK